MLTTFSQKAQCSGTDRIPARKSIQPLNHNGNFKEQKKYTAPIRVGANEHLPVALFTFIGCAIGIGLMATTAFLSHSPFVFPSLGPTAFLFFSSPTAPAASPRNTIIGHAIGVLAGYFSLVITGLTTAGPALLVGVTELRIIAVILSLSLTAGLMMLLRASHPPAGATTLMVSLGILAQPWQLGVLIVAVVSLTLFAILFNRLAGLSYPLWKTVSHKGRNKATTERSELAEKPVRIVRMG